MTATQFLNSNLEAYHWDFNSQAELNKFSRQLGSAAYRKSMRYLVETKFIATNTIKAGVEVTPELITYRLICIKE